MHSPNYVSRSQPDSNKREGDGSLFCSLTRRKFFLRLSMISWGQFHVMERFCDFLNITIKLQPWLTFLWTTYCPCLLLIITIRLPNISDAVKSTQDLEHSQTILDERFITIYIAVLIRVSDIKLVLFTSRSIIKRYYLIFLWIEQKSGMEGRYMNHNY